jgi:hypothetical protein
VVASFAPARQTWPKRYESSLDLAALHAGAGVVRLDGLARAEIKCSGSGRTGAFLTRGEEDHSENDADGKSFLLGLSFEQLMS